MQTNILWTGREYYSLENCLINTTEIGTTINSSIVGSYSGEIYKVEYQITTNKYWETVFFEVKCQHKNHLQYLKYQGDGKGNWETNGQSAKELQGCIDIDIPLTPFTNSLPINRLKLKTGEEHYISVLYLDLLAQQFTVVKQRYVKLSDTEYHYENVPNDFEADIKVDEHGFVIDYPELFVRTASAESSYQLR